jgi:hypothetical protein
VFKQHTEVLDLVPTPAPHFQRLTNLRLDRRASKERMREQAHKLLRSIHALSKKGMKNAQIARTLGVHRHTVEKYLAFTRPRPKGGTSPRRSAPSHLTKTTSWDAGSRAVTTLHESGRRLLSRDTPVPTRTSSGSPATSKSTKCWENPYRTLHRAS